MSTYYTILTNVGLAKVTNAQALGTVVQWSEMAVGDGNGNDTTPVQTQTALVRERFRAQLNQLSTDPNNPNWLVAELVIPSAQGGWTVREVGVFDEAGDLVAVANFPATYKPQLAEGASKDLVIRIIIEVANTATVQLRIDPAVVLASRSWVETNFLRRSKIAGGTTGQVLKKTGNADEAFAWQDLTSANITVNTVQELQTLATNQTVIDWATITTTAAAYYIGGARLEPGDFTTDSQTRITLARSYPAGTRILGAINEPAGSPVEFVPVSGGGAKLPAGSRRMITDSLTYTLPATTTLTAGAALVVEKNSSANPTINVGAGGAQINNNGALATSYAYSRPVRIEFVFDGTNWLARPMLRQGAFGIGAPILVSNANFNDMMFRRASETFYLSGSGKTGGPPTVTNQDNGWLDVDYVDDLNCRQTYKTISNRDTWCRNFVNGTPTDWTFSYHNGSIVGTVSESGGIPTGAIIQRGSNPNGEFTRLADGSQHAWNNNNPIVSDPIVFSGTVTSIDNNKFKIGRWFNI